jgi:hypothetical protein
LDYDDGKAESLSKNDEAEVIEQALIRVNSAKSKESSESEPE